MKSARFHPALRGQATLEFIVYVAILLGIVALFLPSLVRLNDYSRDFSAYSMSQSETISQAYFASSSYLSGAHYPASGPIEVSGQAINYNGSVRAGSMHSSVTSPFSMGSGAFSLVERNVE